MKNDIEEIKKGINIVDYLESRGYKVDEKASGDRNRVLRSEDGAHKLDVKKNHNGHWVYNNWREQGNDSGTIIDFVMNHDNLNFTEALKKLRSEYVNNGKTSRNDLPETTKSIKKKPHEIQEWMSSSTIESEPTYLFHHRHLHKSILKEPKFVGTVFVEKKFKNVVFPHKDTNGEVVGAEKRNRNYKGFVEGGVKTGWVSNHSSNDKYLVVTESPIDALSHAQIYKSEINKTRYLSVGGKWDKDPSSKAADLIRKNVAGIEKLGGQVVLAFDNDKQGLAHLKSFVKMFGNDMGTKPVMQTPDLKDWNEDLELHSKHKIKSSRLYYTITRHYSNSIERNNVLAASAINKLMEKTTEYVGSQNDGLKALQILEKEKPEIFKRFEKSLKIATRDPKKYLELVKDKEVALKSSAVNLAYSSLQDSLASEDKSKRQAAKMAMNSAQILLHTDAQGKELMTKLYDVSPSLVRNFNKSLVKLQAQGVSGAERNQLENERSR